MRLFMPAWLAESIEYWVRKTPSRTNRWLDRTPRWAIRRTADANLIRLLQYVWRRSPAERKRWESGGLRERDLHSPDVLARIPFTTGPDLADRPEDFFCVPPEELIHLFSTSGTRGTVKKIYLTARDLDRQLTLMGATLSRLPGASRALVMYCTEYTTWSTGPIARRAVERAGMFGLLSNTRHSVPEQIQLIKEHRIDLLLAAPAYLHRITVEAREDLRRLGVRYILLAAEPWSEEFRAMIESAWGAKALDVYATTECAYAIAGECRCQNGLHISETDLRVEIVDPATGRVLPDGVEGEIVVTTLNRRGMPLVRYRTGDLASLLSRPERCECGLPLRKMSRVRGRLDDMLFFGGDNVFPDEFDRALLAVPGVTDYQLVIEKDSYKDVCHVTVEAARRDQGLKDAVLQALLAIPRIRVANDVAKTFHLASVDVVSPGALSAGRPKTRRIIDHRPPSVRPAPPPHP